MKNGRFFYQNFNDYYVYGKYVFKTSNGDYYTVNYQILSVDPTAIVSFKSSEYSETPETPEVFEIIIECKYRNKFNHEQHLVTNLFQSMKRTMSKMQIITVKNYLFYCKKKKILQMLSLSVSNQQVFPLLYLSQLWVIISKNNLNER